MNKWIFCSATTLALCCGAAAAHENEKIDYAQEIELFRPLAEKGNPIAQYNLGVIYASGKGVKKDYREAVIWYRLAAAQGHALAQYRLGVMYGKGEGVTRDPVRAHMWTGLAAAKGNSGAQKDRDGLARRMTPAQIAEARKLENECEKHNFKDCD